MKYDVQNRFIETLILEPKVPLSLKQWKIDVAFRNEQALSRNAPIRRKSEQSIDT